MLELVQASLSRAAKQRSPDLDYRFVMDEARTDVYVNYAVPSGPQYQIQITELLEEFKNAERRPRVEFAKELWPGLTETLEQAGFKFDTEMPLLGCNPTTFKPTSIPIRCILASTVDQMREYYETANTAFEYQWPITDKGLENDVKSINAGEYSSALAYIENQKEAVSVACITRASELVGVATRPQHRSHGYAASVCSFLITNHFKSHELVWLSAETDGAQKLYERLGFQRIGTHHSWML